MPFLVTGSPTQAFVDAIKQALEADSILVGLVTGVYGALPRDTRTPYPYLVLGHRHRDNDFGSMQLPGGMVTLQIDGWSDRNGASEMHAIFSRAAVALERRTLALSGFSMVRGSLTCEMEDVFFEPDEDKPESGLYHGVQRWSALIEEQS